MPKPLKNVDCIFYADSNCHHGKAPSRLLRLPNCIAEFPLIDRRVPCGCILQIKYTSNTSTLPPKKP
jgi:hypothetical protein